MMWMETEQQKGAPYTKQKENQRGGDVDDQTHKWSKHCFEDI